MARTKASEQSVAPDGIQSNGEVGDATVKKQQPPTPYVVLGSNNDHDAGPWSVVGRFTAHGQQAAMKDAHDYLEQAEGVVGFAMYLAVPVSSWKPLRHLVEQVTRELWQ